MQFTQSRQFSGQADPVLDVISTDYKLFVLQVGTGVDVDYVILSETGAQWEAGTGQLAVGGAITRNTVTDNSLGTTAKIDFDVGRHLIVVLEKVTATVGAIDAIDVAYNNATSGLTATDVQAAIDELAASGSGYTAKSFIDLGLSSGSTSMLISNNTKTGENGGSANSVQLISHQFFGGGGKFYFEVLVDNDASNLGIGVVDRFRLLSNVNHMGGSYVGQEVSSFAYWHNGYKYNNNAGTSGYSTFTDNDVVGVAVDTTNGYIWFAKNNTWIEGDPAAGTTPSYTSNYLKSHLHIYVTPYAVAAKATIRGLTSEFTYTAPTGFSAAFD